MMKRRKRKPEKASKAIRESIRSTRGVASQYDLKQLEKRIMATLEQVLEKVTEQDTMLDGVRELIVGLRQQVKDAGGNQAKIDAIFDKASQNVKETADALTENVQPDVPPVV